MHVLRTCKTIYNELLALSIDSYTFGKVSLTKFDYNTLMKGKYPVYSQVAQNVSDRVHKALSNFFRRMKDKSCTKKGFPRFKSRAHSITFPQSGFKLLSNKRLRLSKIGKVPMVLHRLPQGTIKTLTIKQNKAGQWFAFFSCELPARKVNIKHPSPHKVGIDVGLENFATLSNGEMVAHPHYILKAEKKLTILTRRLSRKKKGSFHRRKARFKLAKQHLKVANQRMDFLHKLSHRITQSSSFIAVENLNIRRMVRNHRLAKNINDASWNSFLQLLSYKAVACGGQLVKVNPRNTSKTCSKCGALTEMPLRKRAFLCSHCNFACHRDLNASMNILMVGMDYAEPNACEHSVRPSLKAVVNEAGTTLGNS